MAVEIVPCVTADLEVAFDKPVIAVQATARGSAP
jgi:hypothetical protein